MDLWLCIPPSFLRISLVCLSIFFCWITVQSVVQMWYSSVGEAKVLVASTSLGMEILLEIFTSCFITDLLL